MSVRKGAALDTAGETSEERNPMGASARVFD
jgi:hypothetical protein